MMHLLRVNTDFWTDPYVAGLSSRGKLALFYALNRAEEGRTIIVEDMAYQTGLELSEVYDWLSIFVRQRRLAQDAIVGLLP